MLRRKAIIFYFVGIAGFLTFRTEGLALPVSQGTSGPSLLNREIISGHNVSIVSGADVVAIPERNTIALFTIGALGLAGIRFLGRKRRIG